MKKIGTNSNLRESISSNRFRIKKHLGQNFLKDQNILANIVKAAGIDRNTCVIEVGPGMGSLTQVLLESAKHVLAYEVDSELVPILTENLQGFDNLTLINEDILRVDIDKDIERTFGPDSKVVVVSNLPYYITTPILMRFLETSKRISKLVLMVQLEVGKRITSNPDTKDYNALTVAIKYRSESKILFKVPKSAFIPEPNVDSAVIEVKILDSIPNTPKDEVFFFSFIHECFSQRRKTLVNNIHHHHPEHSKQSLESLLTSEGFDPQIRAEALGLDDFIKLSDRLIDFRD